MTLTPPLEKTLVQAEQARHQGRLNESEQLYDSVVTALSAVPDTDEESEGFAGTAWLRAANTSDSASALEGRSAVFAAQVGHLVSCVDARARLTTPGTRVGH